MKKDEQEQASASPAGASPISGNPAPSRGTGAVPAPGPAMTGPPVVLVVDDTSISRVILKNVLFRRMGLEVIEAANGQEALWQMEKKVPDLIITDLSMPVMDGFAFMDKARDAQGNRIPMIVISVYGDKERLLRAVRLGAVDFIVKPFEQETVIAKVNNALAPLRKKNQAPAEKKNGEK